MTDDLRTRLARFLCEESQWRLRMGPFWNDLSIQQKQLWLEDADRFKSSLERFGLTISEIDHRARELQAQIDSYNAEKIA